MKEFTANYSHTNHNFVVQNLTGKRITNDYLPAICILKNVLQRGKPTLMSSFLQEKIGKIHKSPHFEKAYPLIDKKAPKWERIIKGNTKGNHNPAQKFFDILIPKYLPEYEFIQQLIIPEIEINDITQVPVDDFAKQQVDFYLPQAYLIIEIDGKQHLENPQKTLDRQRDTHTLKYGVQTIRIQVSDLEAENDTFMQKIDEIRKRIASAISIQTKRKKENNTFISLKDYEDVIDYCFDKNNPNYLASAIIRFQILILELLEYGILDFDKKWKFELIERDINDFAELALEDIFLWFKHIFKLQKIEFNLPKYEIIKRRTKKDFSNNPDSIKIDFSILERYTDVCQNFEDIIFVRTHYLDEYRYYKNGNAKKIEFVSFEPYDYFKISTTDSVKYKLQFGGDDSDEKALLFLLWNIFLQNDESLIYDTLEFREGQIPIIANALSQNHTIGLLPTGSGKSVCYQLCAILQPAVSFVVCPIKALMFDQKADLDNAFFSRTNHISSDNDGEDREKIQTEFKNGKFFFIFISPERFQVKEFRKYFDEVNEKFKIAYAVIDEVHCLSEWGHDFRISYLNLSSTIKKLCNNFRYIGLTATASINVLKDIQIELGIQDQDVITQADYTREELEFIVIDDKNKKETEIITQLAKMKTSIGALEEKGKDTRCGIIFTPNVNGEKGCYDLSKKLNLEFKKNNIKYFPGKCPSKKDKKGKKQDIMPKDEFKKYKNKVQKEFKENKISLLTATKAFGMGVNKGNIYYTIHYGIPGSMESLYQEAGRAGRDKLKFKDKKAQCLVLLSKSSNQALLNKIWDIKTQLPELKKIRKNVSGDVGALLFLFVEALDNIDYEVKIIKNLYDKYMYKKNGKKDVSVNGKVYGYKKSQNERAIYRLKQLGIIDDWRVINFFDNGEFSVDFNNYTLESIKESLVITIQKYDKGFSLKKIETESKYSEYKKIMSNPKYNDLEKYLRILLRWSYDNFAYNRRQSLKTIYENSCDFADGVISSAQFKKRLENYFKFTHSSFILQHIAEKLDDYQRWFEVFYQFDDKKNITEKFISLEKQESLRDNLSRFIESYRYNVGLDLISGLIRLLLNDYDNADGRNRFESAMKEAVKFDNDKFDFVFENIISLGKEVSESNKEKLSQSIHKYIENQALSLKLAIELGDTFSKTKYIEIVNKKLETINEKIHGGFRKIG